jgi:hypothetical protein
MGLAACLLMCLLVSPVSIRDGASLLVEDHPLHLEECQPEIRTATRRLVLDHGYEKFARVLIIFSTSRPYEFNSWNKHSKEGKLSC